MDQVVVSAVPDFDHLPRFRILELQVLPQLAVVAPSSIRQVPQRVEDVEDEEPTGFEVLADAPERTSLIHWAQEVLKRPVGGDNEGELSAEREFAHIPPDELYSLL